MTPEVAPKHTAETIETPTDRYAAFERFSLKQCDPALPQVNDPFTMAYHTAFAQQITTNAEFQELFGYVINDLLPDVRPGDISRRALKTFQHIEITNGYGVFPYNRATPESWREGPFESVLHDDDYQEQFFGNIVHGVMSSVHRRGVLLKFAARLYTEESMHERSTDADGLDVIDLGSGPMEILTRTLLEHHPLYPGLDYDPFDIMRGHHRARSAPTLDAPTTEQVNEWMSNNPLPIRRGVGLDIVPFDYDEALRSRAQHDGRYMGELLISRLTQQEYTLVRANPPELTFYNLDATNFDTEPFAKQFDVAYLSTMLWGINDMDKRQQILRNAEQVTRDTGQVIVHDFIETITKTGRVHIYSEWPAYTYTLWVKDMRRADLGYQRAATVFSGRIEKLIPNEAVLGRLPLAVELGLVRS